MNESTYDESLSHFRHTIIFDDSPYTLGFSYSKLHNKWWVKIGYWNYTVDSKRPFLEKIV